MKIKEGGVMDIQKNRKEHVLKTDPAVFQDVLDGKKTFEIRFNDRGYQVGDLIVLKETKFTGQQMREGSPLIYTGREMQKQISYILSGYGLQDGWVILGIQDIKATKAQAVPEATSVGDELQSWVAVNSFAASDAVGDFPIVDANALAEVIEKLTGASQ